MTALLMFVATYLILAIQGIPKVHIDRPTGALLGAVGMVAFGVLSLQQAYRAIDLETLLFLLGMMILIAYLELSDFFEFLERWVVEIARDDVHISFMRYLRVGVPVTLLTLIAGVLVLAP